MTWTLILIGVAVVLLIVAFVMKKGKSS